MHEQRIGSVVQDNEACVHWGPLIGTAVKNDCVGVAADIVVLFEEGDLVTVLKQVEAAAIPATPPPTTAILKRTSFNMASSPTLKAALPKNLQG